MTVYNENMKQYHHPAIFVLLIVLLLIPSCSSVSTTTQIPMDTPIPQATSTSVPTQTIPTITPTVNTILLDEQDVLDSLCQGETQDSTFSLTCDQSNVSIQQKEDRRGVDIFLQRLVPVSYDGSFSLKVTATSTLAADEELDENQYGLTLINAQGVQYALRFSGQYFDLETWQGDEEIKVTEHYNMSYSPALLSSGYSNRIQLDCTDTICDLYLNDVLSARYLLNLTGVTSAIGIFTSSDWDQEFGQVSFSDLELQPLSDTSSQLEPILISDDLTADNGTFSQSGMSGAFHNYFEDGFHFSPLIPYGYYAAKATTSLADVAISATVHMHIDLTSNSSQYAGLLCRSNQDGMYMAVIRADGTYSIFRDTPQSPFALLAERSSDAIVSGDADNDLRLECVGSQINFYINDIQVESLTDTRYGIRFGRVGLFTKAGKEPALDAIVFSNLLVEEIQE